MFPLGRESDDRSMNFCRLILCFVISPLKQTKEQTADTVSGSDRGRHLRGAAPNLHRESSPPHTPLLDTSGPSLAHCAASPTRLWPQPRPSGSTHAPKHSKLIRLLLLTPAPQWGEDGVKHKAAQLGLMRRADCLPKIHCSLSVLPMLARKRARSHHAQPW